MYIARIWLIKKFFQFVFSMSNVCSLNYQTLAWENRKKIIKNSVKLDKMTSLYVIIFITESSKTATEVSIDNGDITLPEIHIMKVTDEHLTTALCARCLQRCDSQQSVTSFNSNSLLPNKYMKSSSLGT